MLGTFHAAGEGVKQDFSEAYVWFWIAVASGEEQVAKVRDSTVRTLSPQALEKAQDRARQRYAEIQARVEKH